MAVVGLCKVYAAMAWLLIGAIHDNHPLRCSLLVRMRLYSKRAQKQYHCSGAAASAVQLDIVCWQLHITPGNCLRKKYVDIHSS